MHFTNVVAASLAVAGSAIATPTAHWGKDKATGLSKAIRDRGRSFVGAALTIRNDTAEQAILSNRLDFNSVTPENDMKWESTEPTQGNFTFAGADRFINWAKERHYQTHCHNLVWHSQLPKWVSEGGFDNKTLIQVMKSHIKAVAGRYKGQCTRWDVVNEALNENGTYRESVWYTTIGEAYLPLAFKFASQVDPKAQLFYNDYNLEYNNNKTAGAQRIVKLIQSYGVKINGVGLQAHLTSEATPTSPGAAPDQKTLEASLRTYTRLGVDVVYTELDMRLNTPATPEKAAVQAAAYQRVAASCLAVRRCIGITLWGITDKYSWIPGVFEGEGYALVWDENYQKKPAYYGLLKGIRGY